MLELYDFNNSVCAQKVRMTLAEKGLDWESVELNLRKGDQHTERYLKLNPAGVVAVALICAAILSLTFVGGRIIRGGKAPVLFGLGT